MTPVIHQPLRCSQRGPRTGTTLVEVLVAIFIMGIGCLAILAMFPLGAINMARSIRDDRVGHSAANARAIAIAHHIAFDTSVTTYFDNASGNVTNSATHLNAPLDGPSYPVFVDPVGWVAYAGLNQTWLAGDKNLVPRRTLSFIPSSPATLRWCSLLDDIQFDTNGTPAHPIAATVMDRGGKYSWAWLLRRPKAGVRAVCEMTIIVYEQRSLSGGTVKIGINESKFDTTAWVATRPNVITLNIPAGKLPQVKEGGWILDATPSLVGGKLQANCHAKFYRVVSVGDIVGAGPRTIELELASTVQGFNAGDIGQFVVLENVVDVIECGAVWKAWNN